MSDSVHAQVSVCFCTLRLSTITQCSYSHHLTSSSIQSLHNFLIIQPTSVVMKGPRPQKETYSHASLKWRPWLKKWSELPTNSTYKPQSSYCMFTTNQRFFNINYCHYLRSFSYRRKQRRRMSNDI